MTAAGTLAQVLQAATQSLATTSPTAALDAELLLRHCLQKDRAWLSAHRDQILDSSNRSRYQELISRRRQGEPIAYLTGSREFWSLTLSVSPAVLIPRPETELVVERALAHIPADAEWLVADLGTGSGAIALAIAKERPRCKIVATDISRDALSVARHNARQLKLVNLEFRQGHWFDCLPESFDAALCNPPYVADQDPHLSQGDLPYEPGLALTAGRDGLDAVREIIDMAQKHIVPGGWLVTEHADDQAASVADDMQQRGYFHIDQFRDLAGLVRVSECRRP